MQLATGIHHHHHHHHDAQAAEARSDDPPWPRFSALFHCCPQALSRSNRRSTVSLEALNMWWRPVARLCKCDGQAHIVMATQHQKGAAPCHNHFASITVFWRQLMQAQQWQCSLSASNCCFPLLHQLRVLVVVQQSLTKDTLRSLVQVFIHCRLDYFNAVLAGITDTQIKWLQSIHNPAAHLASGAWWHDHITPVLRSLHWLPVQQVIIFKTAVLIWKCIHGVAPPYLQKFCVPWRKSNDVLNCGRHQLDASTC